MTVEAGIRRHPWNTSFTWRDHTPPFRRVTDAQARQFDELGFFVLEDAFDPEAIAAVRDEIDTYEAKLEAVLREQENDRIMIAEAGAITFTTHLVTRSPQLRAFAADEVFVDLCVDLVGPDANLYWDQAVYKKPEKPRRFPWHQDNGYTFVEPQQYLTCWVALTDATVENGCPQVAPGLHRLGTLAHTYVDPLGFECFSEPAEVVTAPVRAGGVVVFSSLTPHLTGPNTTDEVRKAYILQYAPAGARIQEGDARKGPPTVEVDADDPERQFPVARAGRRA
jgi:ectoine hydroxylase-related dioxygenase (phytanoyl-CoA dioxygenase family)